MFRVDHRLLYNLLILRPIQLLLFSLHIDLRLQFLNLIHQFSLPFHVLRQDHLLLPELLVHLGHRIDLILRVSELVQDALDVAMLQCVLILEFLQDILKLEDLFVGLLVILFEFPVLHPQLLHLHQGKPYLILEFFATLLHEQKPLFEETFLGRWCVGLDHGPLPLEHIILLRQSLYLDYFLIIGMVELVVILLYERASTQKMQRSLDFDANLSMSSCMGSYGEHRTCMDLWFIIIGFKQIIEIQVGRAQQKLLNRAYWVVIKLTQNCADCQGKMIQPNIKKREAFTSQDSGQSARESSIVAKLSLLLIKNAVNRSLLLGVGFAFKQIQFHCLRVKRSREVFELQQRCDDSFSSDKSASVRRQKSSDVLRNIKSSLDRQKGFKSSSGLLGLHGLGGEKSKIMEEIAQKLQVKNRVPEVSKTPQASPLSKRVAKLQNFMLLIKREREFNDKPAVILEHKRINRINYHMLSEKLAEERQKSQENRQKEIMGNLMSIKQELKSIQKVQEMIVKNPESSVEVSQVSGQSKQSDKERLSQGATHIIIDLPSPPSNPNIAPLKFSCPPIRFVSGSQPQRKITFLLISPT